MNYQFPLRQKSWNPFVPDIKNKEARISSLISNSVYDTILVATFEFSAKNYVRDKKIYQIIFVDPLSCTNYTK